MTFVPGFHFAGVAAGIKTPGSDRLDLALLVTEKPVTAAAVFTKNRVKAAPVLVSQERVKRGTLRGLVVNAGNANACTGKQGLHDAEEMTALAARQARDGAAAREFAVASTGVIGNALPMERIRAGIARAGAELAEDGFDRFSRAILTTDRGPKIAGASVRLGGHEAVIHGCTKGAGMIAPHMATTLSFVCTDAAASPAWLRRMLREETEVTFNSVTVDGDTSTNDSLFLLASGAAGGPPIRDDGKDGKKLRAAVREVLLSLALKLVRDGEGATKLVRIAVSGASSVTAARAIARSVANSPLVKTALGGADPNWGRILCAAGNAGVAIDPGHLELSFEDVPVVRRGIGVHAGAPETEALAHAVMARASYTIHLRVGSGRGAADCWTCDLSHEYVSINADYRS